jgi:hypothetical protein
MNAIALRYGVLDISNIFRDRVDPYFIDDMHLTEDGNRVVARRMLPDVLHCLGDSAGKD